MEWDESENNERAKQKKTITMMVMFNRTTCCASEYDCLSETNFHGGAKRERDCDLTAYSVFSYLSVKTPTAKKNVGAHHV